MPPGQEGQEGAPSMGTSVTFDEMESALKTGKPTPTDLEKPLEGAGIPDDMKGKPIKDVIAEINARKEREATTALAEEAARRVIAASQPAPTGPTTTVNQPEPEKELTEDELARIYEENPLKAIQMMNAQAEKRVLRNMEGRMAPMAGGFAQMAETEARKRYADEFALFGDDIQQLIRQLPNQAVLTNPKAWDDLIGLVRGRTGNFEKLLKHIQTKTVGASAKEEQALGAGFHAHPRNSPPPAPTGQMSELERAVAREMGLSDDEYIFWRQDTR